MCEDNYYGNPETAGGSCNPCDCSGKIDLMKPGNCDPHTGKCLQCIYNTAGAHCEICRPNYFRLSQYDVCEGLLAIRKSRRNLLLHCDYFQSVYAIFWAQIVRPVFVTIQADSARVSPMSSAKNAISALITTGKSQAAADVNLVIAIRWGL